MYFKRNPQLCSSDALSYVYSKHKELISLHHLPGLSTFLQFPQPKHTKTYYTSLLRHLWDASFNSGDIPAATMVRPNISLLLRLHFIILLSIVYTDQVLQVLADASLLCLPDLHRFIDMIRQQHEKVHANDGLSLYQGCQEFMLECFGDRGVKRGQNYHAMREYLLAMFTEVLLVHGESDQALELMQSRSADIAYLNSSLLAAAHASLQCLKAVHFVHDFEEYIKSSTPTVEEFCADPFVFHKVVYCLRKKQSSALRRNRVWSLGAAQLLRELKRVFAPGSLARITDNVSYDTLYVAYHVGMGQSTEVRTCLTHMLWRDV